MGQSKSVFLESDDNLEDDQIVQKKRIQAVLIENNINTLKLAENHEMITSNPMLSTNNNNHTEGQHVKNDDITKSNMDDHKDENGKESDNLYPEKLKEEEEEEKYDVVDISKYAVNYKHVHFPIIEFTDSMEINDEHSANKLFDIFDKMTINNEDLKLWNFSTTQSAKSKIKSVIEYAETNQNASSDIKVKLRTVTKMLMETKQEQLSEYKHILLLLASHGNVCHVLKEVAINNGYGMMTNNLSKYIKSQSLQQQILKVLYHERVLLVERIHHAFKFSNNVHYIASFHNELAKKIGVKEYNDHQYVGTFTNKSSKYPNWTKNLDQRYFKKLYTTQNIKNCVLKQIEEKKIAYQKIVKFFEENCPENMKKNDFLAKVINIDNGKIDEKWLYWLLAKLEIFLVKNDEWKDIEKCWEYDDIDDIITK